jgi:hypothetical protein
MKHGLSCLFTAMVTLGVTMASAQQAEDQQAQTGGHAWVRSHAAIEQPGTILGGPLRVEVSSADDEIAFWVFPGPRELDPHVFGTPDMPLAYYPAPWPLYGVPIQSRGVNEAGDAFTTTTEPTPFSDNWAGARGSVTMSLLDVTATDAASTEDEIDFEMSFTSPDNEHEYTVTVETPLPHGMAFPFFGGVATNVLLHGISGVGTPLMPTEFTYAAFWGVGSVSRDGEVVNESQLVHVMVTEPVRGADYQLETDANVPSPVASPDDETLHLLVAPYRVNPGQDPPLEHAPVRTGVTVESPQGEMEQPFFHVMINEIEVTGERVDSEAQER